MDSTIFIPMALVSIVIAISIHTKGDPPTGGRGGLSRARVEAWYKEFQKKNK